MHTHATILGHLVGWGLAHRSEDAAIEGLAFLLRRFPSVHRRFTALLRAAQPALPDDLQFTATDPATSGDLALVGRHGDIVRVLVDGRFTAALTDHPPESALDRLAGAAPTLLLFIVPDGRRAFIWRELLARLKAANLPHRELAPQLAEIAGRVGPRLHVLGWGAVLGALAEGTDPDARADLDQLAGLCRIADDRDDRPLQRDQLTDRQVPARILQYVNIARIVATRGAADVFRPVSNRTAHAGFALGHKIQFAGDRGPLAWIGVDFIRWQEYETGPLWLTFDWNLGQAKAVRERLHPWAGDHGRILCDIEDGVMLGLDLLPDAEQTAVVDDIIAQLRVVADQLRKPGKP